MIKYARIIILMASLFTVYSYIMNKKKTVPTSKELLNRQCLKAVH